MMDNYISFSDDEILANGRDSIKALHITIKVKDCTLPKVLIDNGSSLNVMSLSTLMRFVRSTPVLSAPDAGLPRQYRVLFRLVPAIRIKHACSATRTQPTKPFVVSLHTPLTN